MKALSVIKNRKLGSSAKKNNVGFTLIEVLIASSILGVMMLLLFGSLRICSRIWIAGEKHIEASSQMTVVQNFFRTHISSALVVQNNQEIDFKERPDEQESLQELENQNKEDQVNEKVAGSETVDTLQQRQLSFQGNEHEIQFISVMPASAGRGGPQVFTVALKDGETQQLVVTITPFFPLLDDTQEVKEEISILDNVRKFAITYWGVNEFSDQPEWNDNWKGPHLPQLVRIEIEVENQPPWPSLIVSPRLAGQDFVQKKESLDS